MKSIQPAGTVAVAALIERFRRIALDKADGLPCRHDRELHQELSATVRELEGWGPTGRVAMKILLEDGSAEVRRWVAPHVLAAGDQAGRDVLLRDRELPGACGEAAAMALRDWQAGRLTSPLSNGEAGPMLLPLRAERRKVPARERDTAQAALPAKERRNRKLRRRAFSTEIVQETAARLR